MPSSVPTCASSASSTAALQPADTWPLRQQKHPAASARRSEAGASGQVRLANLRLASKRRQTQSETAWDLTGARLDKIGPRLMRSRIDEVGPRLMRLQLRRSCGSVRRGMPEPDDTAGDLAGTRVNVIGRRRSSSASGDVSHQNMARARVQKARVQKLLSIAKQHERLAG